MRCNHLESSATLFNSTGRLGDTKEVDRCSRFRNASS